MDQIWNHKSGTFGEAAVELPDYMYSKHEACGKHDKSFVNEYSEPLMENVCFFIFVSLHSYLKMYL